MFHRLTPQFILDEMAAGRSAGEFEAASLFVDISGFTPLTAALMAHGTEGAEVLAQVLAEVFEPLIEAVHAQGGAIAGFAGDAFKAVFPGADPTTDLAAVTAAWTIRTLLAAHSEKLTRFGAFSFSGKACVGRGPISWELWDGADASHAQQAACVIAGEGIAAAMQLDPHAARGEVVVTPSVYARLPAGTVAATARPDCMHIDSWLTPLPVQGSPQPDAQRPPPPAQAALAARFFPSALLHTSLQGEFRRVTTLFVNLERALTPAERVTFQRLLFDTLARLDGFLCRVGAMGSQDNGQTLLLLWGAPAGSEQDVLRALAFLVALRADSPIRFRAGVTTGMAYAGFVGAARREEYTAYGTYVNLAARQVMAAAYGEIWLDEATASQAAGYATVDHGSHRFKGFAATQKIHLLTGRGQVETDRFYSGRLIGRERELSCLEQALHPLDRGRFGGLVTVIGEAGMGKSRLVHEFLRRQPQVQSFLCQSDEILRQPLNPFRHWLNRYFNQRTGNDEASNKAAFAARIEQLMSRLTQRTADASTAGSPDGAISAAEIPRISPFLGALIDLRWAGSIYEQLEPQLRFENTLDALKTLIKAESLLQPVVVQLEDAHWLDADSAEFLRKLLRNVDGYPFIVIATSRPPEASSHDFDIVDALSGECAVTTLDLAALDRNSLAGLAEAILGHSLTPSLADELAARADGNPFFAEQILLYLREQGLLQRGDQGWQLLDEAGSMTANSVLSGDVRAVLTARLDRLAPPVKEVVQTAAVLGREFDIPVLMQILGESDALASHLEQAGAAAIWSAIDQTRYLFRHALLRDAAYDMQLRAQLRSLHRQAANAVQTLFEDELAPRYADLAYHFGRAEARNEERRYAGLAGGYAAEQFANDDALRYLQRALELSVDAAVDERLALLLQLETVHNTLGSRDAQASALVEMDELAAEAATPADLAQLALRRANLARVTTDYPEALRAAKAALAWAIRAGRGDLEIDARNVRGRVLWRMHRPEEAAQQLNEALTQARDQNRPEAIARNLYDLGLVEYNEGAYDAALTQFQQARATFAELADIKGEALCQGMIGTVQTRRGDFSDAIENLRTGLKLVTSIGWVPGQTYFLANLGDAELAVGLLDEARLHHEQAHRAAIEINDREGEAYSLDGLGLIAYFGGDYATAQQRFQAALTLYEQIGQKRLQLYTYNHLAYAAYYDGELQTAAESFAHAEALLAEGNGEAAIQLDTQAAAAAISWALGERTTALAKTDAISDHLANHGMEGIEYPIQVCWICYEVNHAAAVETPERRQKADLFLRRAVEHFTTRAKMLPPALAAAYHNNIPIHHAVQAMIAKR